MNCVCSLCSRSFVAHRLRSSCWICKPHPHCLNPLSIVQEYEAGAKYLDLSIKYHVSRSILWQIIKSFGTSRTRGSYHTFPSVTLDLDWLDGWLLGDGHLGMGDKDRSRTARAAHSSKYREYCDYVSQHWRRMGLTHEEPCLINQEDRNDCIDWHVRSHAHPALTDQWHRWYPQGIKRVPHDLKLTSTIVREWYLGDGSLMNGRYPLFVVSGLPEEDMEFLYGLVCQLFGSNVRKHVFSVEPGAAPVWHFYVRAVVVATFFSYIGSCTIPIYRYKWPMKVA